MFDLLEQLFDYDFRYFLIVFSIRNTTDHIYFCMKFITKCIVKYTYHTDWLVYTARHSANALKVRRYQK